MSIAYMGPENVLIVSGEHIEQFKEILARGLNTAPPEKWADWIKVSDALAHVGDPS